MTTFDKIVYGGTAIGALYYGLDIAIHWDTLNPALKAAIKDKAILGAAGGSAIGFAWAVFYILKSFGGKIKNRIQDR